ncbi:UNVERIFIED_CONTAM: putative cytochrome c biosynthesis protein [Sesamum calycinum]|uniref:Cytochrome c biosynthesis protein n=1 Tax=Sesamum calycinum TaxID=2727403 RepID=A0AAW2JJS9_9LAMI
MKEEKSLSGARVRNESRFHHKERFPYRKIGAAIAVSSTAVSSKGVKSTKGEAPESSFRRATILYQAIRDRSQTGNPIFLDGENQPFLFCAWAPSFGAKGRRTEDSVTKFFEPRNPSISKAPLLGWASFDASTPNKLRVGIVELSLEKVKLHSISPRYEQKSGAQPQLYTPFVLRTLVDSELRSRRNRTFDGPALFYAPLYPERKMSFAPMGARRSAVREKEKGLILCCIWHEMIKRELRLSMNSGLTELLALLVFFSPFLSASSDPFVRNFFVRTEPLAESNPVPQDPISAIHPPCIYAGDVASAMGFGLCRSKMMNGIVALHSPLMRKDAAEKNGTLFRSVGCVGSRITSELFTQNSKMWAQNAILLYCYVAIEACLCCFGGAFSPSLRSGHER